EQKGHLYFIQVLSYLQNEIKDQLKVVFVGDGPLRELLESELNKHKLRNYVTFTGVVNDVENYYMAFDCVALLSNREGMPNVVIEAMAFALPVIANPVGNVSELLANHCGLVNYDNEPGKTAGLFVELWKNPMSRKQIGERARNKVIQQFSIDRVLRILSYEYGFCQGAGCR
ncbi:MAG: glycosyltransferase, partial [Chitinophagales bacterium]|nr:glycosyltransferase [Chitinophagales bacterium]